MASRHTLNSFRSLCMGVLGETLKMRWKDLGPMLDRLNTLGVPLVTYIWWLRRVHNELCPDVMLFRNYQLRACMLPDYATYLHNLRCIAPIAMARDWQNYTESLQFSGTPELALNDTTLEITAVFRFAMLGLLGAKRDRYRERAIEQLQENPYLFECIGELGQFLPVTLEGLYEQER